MLSVAIVLACLAFLCYLVGITGYRRSCYPQAGMFLLVIFIGVLFDLAATLLMPSGNRFTLYKLIAAVSLLLMTFLGVCALWEAVFWRKSPHLTWRDGLVDRAGYWFLGVWVLGAIVGIMTQL